MKKQNSILSCILFMVFLFSACSQSRTSTPSSNNNSTNEKPTKAEPEKKECYVCKGTGMETCGMCDGTGINNMGVNCGCQQYNHTMIQMGRETSPYHGPYHKCLHCKGTVYAN